MSFRVFNQIGFQTGDLKFKSWLKSVDPWSKIAPVPLLLVSDERYLMADDDQFCSFVSDVLDSFSVWPYSRFTSSSAIFSEIFSNLSEKYQIFKIFPLRVSQFCPIMTSKNFLKLVPS